MKHPLESMIIRRNKGINCGIASYCTANELAIEAAMEKAMIDDDYVLIEATANQVNQFGGYTGMQPVDYVDFVFAIADQIGFERSRIILGGDHLGPLTWVGETADQAMPKAKELIKLFVLAGFTKIHLDTSMKLADDPLDGQISTELIANRGAQLCQVAEEAYEELLASNPNALAPVYIVGSEVPIPGGATEEEEDGLQVTLPSDLMNTIDIYKSEFETFGLTSAWDRVIAVVVQPGVEFGDATVDRYDRDNAKDLCDAIKAYPGLVLEGHSTDYQSPQALREMVEDGIAILKVGPALTFGLREALFSLSLIEAELMNDKAKQSNFIEVLVDEMVSNPGNWKKHYHGSQKEIDLALKYSYSDRCRYYLGSPKVAKSIEQLFENLSMNPIPMSLLRQYMPLQYNKVRDGKLDLDARCLAKYGVTTYIDEYMYGVKESYVMI